MFDIEDLRERPVRGITTTSYEIRVSVPINAVSHPEAGIGINPYTFNGEPLQQCGFFARRIVIEQVNKESVVITFTVAEPYLKKFYANLIKAESAELIKEQ